VQEKTHLWRICLPFSRSGDEVRQLALAQGLHRTASAAYAAFAAASAASVADRTTQRREGGTTQRREGGGAKPESSVGTFF